MSLYKTLKQVKSYFFRKKKVIDSLEYSLLPANGCETPEIDSDHMKLLWFIPDFNKGAGGHNTIFRMIHYLEKLGVENEIIMCGKTQWGKAKGVENAINKYFYPLKANIYLWDDFSEDHNNNYHGAIATSFQTAYYVRSFGRCHRKFYFVQDYEPYFFPRGSQYTLAEETYRFGFECITAGTWLKKKLENKFGLLCHSFSFSYDNELYAQKLSERNDIAKRKNKIFFYARPVTDRRGFQLGVSVLKHLFDRNPDIEILMAGWDVNNYQIPFPYKNLGIVEHSKLPQIYADCKTALVLSFTNLSLLPLEIIAAGCHVVLNEGKNNEWLDQKDFFTYSKPTVEGLTNALEETLSQYNNINEKLMNGHSFVQSTSWKEEVFKIKKFLDGRLF